jgi:hypothetical protein
MAQHPRPPASGPPPARRLTEAKHRRGRSRTRPRMFTKSIPSVFDTLRPHLDAGGFLWEQTQTTTRRSQSTARWRTPRAGATPSSDVPWLLMHCAGGTLSGPAPQGGPSQRDSRQSGEGDQGVKQAGDAASELVDGTAPPAEHRADGDGRRQGLRALRPCDSRGLGGGPDDGRRGPKLRGARAPP